MLEPDVSAVYFNIKDLFSKQPLIALAEIAKSSMKKKYRWKNDFYGTKLVTEWDTTEFQPLFQDESDIEELEEVDEATLDDEEKIARAQKIADIAAQIERHRVDRERRAAAKLVADEKKRQRKEARRLKREAEDMEREQLERDRLAAEERERTRTVSFEAGKTCS